MPSMNLKSPMSRRMEMRENLWKITVPCSSKIIVQKEIREFNEQEKGIELSLLWHRDPVDRCWLFYT